MNKLQLPNVTLAAVSSVKIYETIKALEYSMQGIEFGEVVLITHRKPLMFPKAITYKHTSKLTDIDCFNYKIAYELGDYIQTDYVLLIHYDGFVVHPEKWRDEFLEYDYIGSPGQFRSRENTIAITIFTGICAGLETAFPCAAKGFWTSQGRQGLCGRRTRTAFIMKIFSSAAGISTGWRRRA